MMKKGSKWGKVKEVVFKRQMPTTSAWSRVDMSLLFPDLYRTKVADQITDSIGRIIPKDNAITSPRQIYIASQSVGLYSVLALKECGEVVLGFGNGRFNIHDMKTCKRVHTVQVSPDEMPVTCVREFRESNNHRIVAGTADGILNMYNYKGSEVVDVTSTKMDCPIYSIDTSTNYHICALSNRKILVIDVHSSDYVRDVGVISDDGDLKEEEEIGHSGRVTCVKFHPTQEYICVSGGWDKTVYLWDIRVEKAAVRAMKGPKICGDGIDIRDNKMLTASFFTENALQLWDLGSGDLIENVRYRDNDNDPEYLYSCRFVDSERVFAGGTGRKDAKVININSHMTEGVILDKKPIHSIDYQDGVCVAGGVSCYVHVGDLNSADINSNVNSI